MGSKRLEEHSAAVELLLKNKLNYFLDLRADSQLKELYATST